MLHAKFQDHRTSGSREEQFLEVFTIYNSFLNLMIISHLLAQFFLLFTTANLSSKGSFRH